MTGTPQKVGGFLLGAVLLAAAAPAQTFHNLYFMGDSSNELTSVLPAHGGGYIATANFADAAALVKLQANGELDWTFQYKDKGSALPLRAVKVHGAYQSYFWTGHQVGVDKNIPVLALTNVTGSVHWARRIELGMNAEAKDLTYDEKSFWVAGTGWPGGGRADPWFARFDTSGNAMWVHSFHFNNPCQLNSLTLADDGGVVGVGQVLVDIQGALRQRMFALKVDQTGTLKWAVYYEPHKVQLPASQQWLADISNSGSVLYAAGVITDLCTDPLSPNCVPRPRSILAATIDHMSGSMQKVWAVYDPNGRDLWANTIAGPIYRMAIGGKVDNPSGSEALLLSGVFEDPQATILQARLYGDGAGPFTSQVEDVASMDDGYVLVTQQRHNLLRPAILRTDQNLSTAPAGQACEYSIPLQATSLLAAGKGLDAVRNTHEISRMEIDETLIYPHKVPCTQLP